MLSDYVCTEMVQETTLKVYLHTKAENGRQVHTSLFKLVFLEPKVCVRSGVCTKQGLKDVYAMVINEAPGALFQSKLFKCDLCVQPVNGYA